MSTFRDYVQARPAKRARAALRADGQRVAHELTRLAVDEFETVIAAEMLPRRQRPAHWIAHARKLNLSPRRIAVAVLGSILTWDSQDKAAPSGPTVYKRIIAALDAGAHPHRTKIGANLLVLAITHGFAQRYVTGTQDDPVERIYSSSQTGADLLGALQVIAREKPPSVAAAPCAYRVRKNYRGLEHPTIGPSVVSAIDVLRETKWSINAYMLDVLQRAPDTQKALQDAYSNRLSRTYRRAQFGLLSALADAENWAASFPTGFYFPLALDFRGRVYQEAGALTFTGGSDAARSMLQFADGEPLTAEGRMYLAAYMKRCAGREYSDDELAAIVADPWRDLSWFHAAKKKDRYQFLAAAHSYVQPEGTPVGVPLVIDSRCSAYQHYSMLARDERLGAMVGLTNTFSAAQDLYTVVGKRCNVHRAAAKPVVSVVLYGAGPESAVEDIQEEMQEAGTPLSREDAFSLAAELKAATFHTVGPAAIAIYKHLRKLGQTGAIVRWETPDGFCCVQDYRRMDKRHETVDLELERRTTFKFIERFPTDEIDGMRGRKAGKQVASLAPNFIHSLDACLLRLAVLHGSGFGISKWAVAHDAFGTHPNYGTALAQAPREAAKQMYDRNSVSRLLGWDAGELPPEFTLEFMTDETG